MRFSAAAAALIFSTSAFAAPLSTDVAAGLSTLTSLKGTIGNLIDTKLGAGLSASGSSNLESNFLDALNLKGALAGALNGGVSARDVQRRGLTNVSAQLVALLQSLLSDPIDINIKKRGLVETTDSLIYLLQTLVDNIQKREIAARGIPALNDVPGLVAAIAQLLDETVDSLKKRDSSDDISALLSGSGQLGLGLDLGGLTSLLNQLLSGGVSAGAGASAGASASTPSASTPSASTPSASSPSASSPSASTPSTSPSTGGASTSTSASASGSGSFGASNTGNIIDELGQTLENTVGGLFGGSSS